MRRLFVVLLAFVTPLALLTSCGTQQNAQDVSITVKAPAMAINWDTESGVIYAQDFLEKAGEMFSKQYTKKNVTVNVKIFEYVDEKLAITDSFDTKDATDVLFEAYFNMSSYIHTGRVVPLDDIISSELRNDIYDSAWESSMLNGKTYMMPFFSWQNVLIYNKSYMRECGLSKYVSNDNSIQNWETEEWIEILDTLAEKLPKNIYPIMMYAKNNQGDTHIISFLRAFGAKIFDENGYFNFEDEKVIQALKCIKDGVNKGWYPTHAENLEMTDNQELFTNDQLVFYAFNTANALLYDNYENYGFVNYPSNITTSFISGFEVFDNGDSAKTEVSKDFIKYIYETPELLEISSKNIPVSKTIADKYSGEIMMLDEFSKNSSTVIDFMNNSPNWQGSDTSVRSVFYPHIHDLLLGTATPEECAVALNRDCNEALKIGYENSVLHD